LRHAVPSRPPMADLSAVLEDPRLPKDCRTVGAHQDNYFANLLLCEAAFAGERTQLLRG